MPILQDDVITAMSGMYQAADAFGNTEGLSSMDPWYSQWYQNQRPSAPIGSQVGMSIGSNVGGVPENVDTSLHGGTQAQQPTGPNGGLTGNFDPVQYMSFYKPLQVPYSAMVAVADYGSTLTNGKMYLRPDAAAAFQAMDAAYLQQTGQHFQIASAYRNFQSGSPAATAAANSDHSMGGAFDIAGASIQTATQQREFDWLKQHAASYGYGVQGWQWGDYGHFSFSAGGFQGSHSASGSQWGIPTAADKKWIAIANGQGGLTTPSSSAPAGPGQTQAELMRLISPVIRPEDAGAGLGGAAVPFSSVLSGILRPLFTMPKQRQQRNNTGTGQNPAPPKPGMNGVPGIPGQVRVLMQNLHFGTVQAKYNSIIQDFIRAGRATGIDPRLLAMIGQHESEFDPTVVSSAGYGGIMQINTGTHPNWRDPAYNTLEGAKELLGWMQLAQSRGLDPLKYGLAYYNVGGYASQASIQAAIQRYSNTIIQNYQAQA